MTSQQCPYIPIILMEILMENPRKGVAILFKYWHIAYWINISENIILVEIYHSIHCLITCFSSTRLDMMY